MKYSLIENYNLQILHLNELDLGKVLKKLHFSFKISPKVSVTNFPFTSSRV